MTGQGAKSDCGGSFGKAGARRRSSRGGSRKGNSIGSWWRERERERDHTFLAAIPWLLSLILLKWQNIADGQRWERRGHRTKGARSQPKAAGGGREDKRRVLKKETPAWMSTMHPASGQMSLSTDPCHSVITKGTMATL